MLTESLLSNGSTYHNTETSNEILGNSLLYIVREIRKKVKMGWTCNCDGKAGM
jgi:hypothetical protein